MMETGYSADVYDVQSPKGINSILSLSNKDYLKMSQECRRLALNSIG